jgi:UMF1 family MFS transporter
MGNGQHQTTGAAGRSRTGSRGRLIAWCSFDWANSSYPTVVVTFVFAAYFATSVAETPEIGTALWGQAMAFSGLAVAVLAPIFGALADQGGRRKPWIGVFTAAAVLSAVGLWWIEPSPSLAVAALLLVAIGNAAFEFGQVFYNAMLPEVAPPERLGRISGWAWSVGYAGGLVCLALSLVLFAQPNPPLFGLDAGAAEHVRIIGPFVAVWFALFALPLFIFVPDAPARRQPVAETLRRGMRSLAKTLKALPRHGQTGRYLLAHMIYTDGLNTLFAFGGLYAAGTFNMTFEEILIFAILLNVTAGLGAAGFAWVDDWIGPKRTILIALAGLFLASTAILLVDSRLSFTVLGCVIGIFIGPAQSASRSLMVRLAPPAHRTELFGLYALSGKATAFLGPALVGAVTLWADSQRAGMATILVFFLVGAFLMLPLREPARDVSGESDAIR